MKILFLVDDFPPNWAPRVGYLCKYLSLRGYTIKVVTGVRNNKKVYPFLVKYADQIEYCKPKLVTKISRIFDVLESFLPVRILRGERDMFTAANNICAHWCPDIIFCSTCDMFPVTTAVRVSKKNNIPLHIDFRDIVEQLPHYPMLRRHPKFWLSHIRDKVYFPLYLRYRNKAIDHSVSVSTVSNFHKTKLTTNRITPRLIYNGFDPDYFYPRPMLQQDKFILAYSGTLGNESVSDYRMLLKAVHQLILEGQIYPNKIEIRFYSGAVKESNIKSEIEKYNLRKIVIFKDWIPSDQLALKLSEANMLLLFSNQDSKNSINTVYTKLFEYMALDRKIFYCPSDHNLNEKIILDCEAGECTSDFEECKRKLITNYILWQKNGNLQFKSNKIKINQFSRSNQANQFIDMLEESIELANR